MKSAPHESSISKVRRDEFLLCVDGSRERSNHNQTTLICFEIHAVKASRDKEVPSGCRLERVNFVAEGRKNPSGMTYESVLVKPLAHRLLEFLCIRHARAKPYAFGAQRQRGQDRSAESSRDVRIFKPIHHDEAPPRCLFSKLGGDRYGCDRIHAEPAGEIRRVSDGCTDVKPLSGFTVMFE